MNPDDRPRTLAPERVEWVPSSPDEIEVRVFGTWHGPTVPPPAVLQLDGDFVEELGTPPGDDVPPAWSAAFLVPVEARPVVEAGEASVSVGGSIVGLPPATPGRMVAPASDIGTVIDPAVLAERRARRAEIAEQSAAERAASAEQAASTLRAQLVHLEERLARAAEERDALASRVADAERRLRLAEQRGEAECHRCGGLEEELAAERRAVEHEFRQLSDRLASAEEVTEALERELAAARRREEAERAAREHVDEQLRVALERVATLEGAAGDDGEELRRQAAILAERLDEAEAERARLETVAADLETLRARLADAERASGEVADLRARLADAERASGEVADLRARLAEADRERAELRTRLDAARDDSAELETLRARLADAERERNELRARVEDARAADDVEALRARLAEAERERDELRDRAGESADLEVLRAEIAELRRRLDETLAALDAERAAHEATERARQLAAQRTQEERAAREAAERRGGGDPSARERELAEQVASLQAEIAGRTETHRRVQEAIETIRGELGRVRAQVRESRSASAPEVDALNARVRGLEDLVRRRDAELETARAALADAQRAAEEARSSSADTDALRASFEARIAELTAAVAGMRERLQETTAEFERRLGEERARREAAEAQLAALRAAPAAPPEPEAEATEDDALEALIAGLRDQVESAREQLRAWDDPAPEPRPAAASDEPVSEPRPAAAADELTRERLRAIEADLRATVPNPEASVPARDVIASLQQAAERLRAAAQEAQADLDDRSSPTARVEDTGAPPSVEAGAEADDPAGPHEQAPAAPAEGTSPGATPPAAYGPAASRGEARGASSAVPGEGAVATPAPEVAATSPSDDVSVDAAAPVVQTVPLGPRAVDFGAAESPWLKKALQRLAQSDPARAAELLVSLLPLQATAGIDLTYVLTAPTLGAVRVVLSNGSAQIERRPETLAADTRISGSIATLAPLVAGAGGLRTKGVRIEGAKRPAKKLLRRRRPVGLADFALVTPPPAPVLVLAALAAAVEPAWTRGHRFGVTYEIGDERWTVVASDGEPLAITDADEPRAATVGLTQEALLPALQGAASPATVAGDRRAVDVLHAWFDRARGVAAG